MDEANKLYENAPIVWDGDVGGRDGDPKTVYRIQINNVWMWFIGQEKFEPNGNEFKIFISRFGSKDKLATECSGELYRWHFDSIAAAEIKESLQRYFLGPKEKPQGVFALKKARCVGVSFLTGWITVSHTSP